MSKLVQNYLLQQPIGKGVYGQVYKAMHQKSKQLFAVKVIPKSSFKSNPKLQQLAINQISILSSLKHQNIVRFVETLKTPNNFYFVYEYCNEGTLQQILKKKKFLKQNQALTIFRQILQAFKQLNKNNIMHRDLKPDNIFINNGKIKLGDFGFCKLLEVNMAQTMLGSPIYMAPQILREEIYTSKADIWSLGVVLFELLFGYCPFESNSISKLINVLKQNELYIPKQINCISQKTQTLLKKMLVKDQFKRIQWVDLFDFKIDQFGNIVSGYNKQTRIEAIEKYFLQEIKSVGEIIIGTDNINQNSNNITKSSSNNQIQQIKSIQIGSDKLDARKTSNQNVTSLKKVVTSGNSISDGSDFNRSENSSKTVPLQYQTNVHNTKSSSSNNIFTKSVPDYIQASQPLPSAYIPEVIQRVSSTKQRQRSPSQFLSGQTFNNSFLQKHSSWLQAIEMISQLIENQNIIQNDKWIYWIVNTLNERLTIQSLRYPEWTDVIMQEKQQLIGLNKQLDYLQIDTRKCDKKNQLYKLWTKTQKKGQLIQDKAIRFIFAEDKIQNSSKSVEEILLS